MIHFCAFGRHLSEATCIGFQSVQFISSCISRESNPWRQSCCLTYRNVNTMYGSVLWYRWTCVCRVNGKLVALKVIRLQEEEGTPFTAIREGESLHRTLVLLWPSYNRETEAEVWQLWEQIINNMLLIWNCVDLLVLNFKAAFLEERTADVHKSV